MNLAEKLTSLSACEESIAWVGKRNDLDQLWSECDRGDWMAWLISKVANGPINSPEHRKMAQVKAEIALEVIDIFEAKYPDDNRPRKAIEAALAYADGDNYSAAYAADAASAADAADAAYAASAAYAAYAAYAASAAYAAYAADAASAAKKSMRAKIANIIRAHYTVDQIREALGL